MTVALLLFFIGMACVWIGSGIAIKSVSRLALRVRAPQFLISFLVLGFLTSFSEIFVGIGAYLENVPDVFVGNLLGSSVVVFLLIIPLFAFFSRGIDLNHTFTFNRLAFAALVVLLPALLTLDNKVSPIDGLIMVISYVFLLFVQGTDSNVRLEIPSNGKQVKSSLYLVGKTVVSILIVFLGAKLIVDQILVLGTAFSIHPFVLSFIVVSIGTNIPELSIALRSLISHQKSIAFGNYVGSAAFNTLELGILSMLYGKNIPALGSNFAVLLYAVGMVLFVLFGKSKKRITVLEALVLLFIYVGIVLLELWLGEGWQLK